MNLGQVARELEAIARRAWTVVLPQDLAEDLQQSNRSFQFLPLVSLLPRVRSTGLPALNSWAIRPSGEWCTRIHSINHATKTRLLHAYELSPKALSERSSGTY